MRCGSRLHPQAGPGIRGVKGLMNVQLRRGRDEEPIRDRGESARLTHGSLRLQGDRAAAGEARGARRGGKTLKELEFTEEIWPRHYSVKEAVFPFVKFPGADTLLDRR